MLVTSSCLPNPAAKYTFAKSNIAMIVHIKHKVTIDTWKYKQTHEYSGNEKETLDTYAWGQIGKDEKKARVSTASRSEKEKRTKETKTLRKKHQK